MKGKNWKEETKGSAKKLIEEGRKRWIYLFKETGEDLLIKRK